MGLINCHGNGNKNRKLQPYKESDDGNGTDRAQSVENDQRHQFRCFFFLTWDFFSGVRDSVSHTARPDGMSHTDDPPVLMDLPENKSTVP